MLSFSIDRTIFDDERLFRLADTGCVIEYDFFGIETSYYWFSDSYLPTDFMRLFPAFCFSRSLRLRLTSPP